MSDNFLTNFVITSIGIPPYSARGISQTLEPISASSVLRRTVNGLLVDLSDSQFRKYSSTVSCSDQAPPAVASLWPGATLIVDCVVELAYKTIGGLPGRPVVSLSSRVEGDFTFFRPQLTMKFLGFTLSRDEYSHKNDWSFLLEEV